MLLGLLLTKTTSRCILANSTKSCFAGSETLLMESGSTISIADVKVGDRVLAADAFGNTAYSTVISLPHAKNNEAVLFSHITTSSGKDIKMTPDHLILAGSCANRESFSLVKAVDVEVQSCVRTVDGVEQVISNEFVHSNGIYTVVTQSEFLVVNGIVASPFASNHAVANAFYSIYRVAFKYAPALFATNWFLKAHERFSDLVMALSV